MFYEELVELRQVSSSEPRVSLRTNDTSVEVTLDDIKAGMRRIAMHLTVVANPVERELRTTGKSVVQHIFEHWAESMTVAPEDLDYVESCVYLSRRDVIQQGWLMLSGKYVFWVPAAVPSSGMRL